MPTQQLKLPHYHSLTTLKWLITAVCLFVSKLDFAWRLGHAVCLPWTKTSSVCCRHVVQVYICCRNCFPVYCAFVTRQSAKCKCNWPWMFQYWCSSMPCSSWAPIYIGCGFTEVVWHLPVWLFVMPLIRIAVVLFLSDAFHCLAGLNALCGRLFFLKLRDPVSYCWASNAQQFLTSLLLNSFMKSTADVLTQCTGWCAIMPWPKQLAFKAVV